MRINSQLCLTISWLGVLVRTESSTPRSLENVEKQSIRRKYNVGNDTRPEESRQRFSFRKDAFEPLIPPDFQMELLKLKIPVAEDLPRRIEISREESQEDNRHHSEEENLSEQGSQEDSSEGEHGSEEFGRHRGNDEDEDGFLSDEEDERREEEPSDYDDYGPPKNTISFYDDSGEIHTKKSKKKRPHVNYEVTETIPHDTKMVRPMQKVYPLPPPCPGAPPPTYPPTEAPATKMPPPPKPPKFPSVPIFPPFPTIKMFSDPASSVLSKDDFIDSYFPTSFMSSSSSSFPKSMHRMPSSPKNPTSRERYSLGRTKPQKIYKRRASPRVILRYHHPTTLVIRKFQHGPPPDRVIIRKPKPPPVKEVHIHHHHDTPSQVFHIHKDDDGTDLDTARFKAKVEGQRIASHSQYESATNGPFAEPPPNIRLPKRPAT